MKKKNISKKLATAALAGLLAIGSLSACTGDMSKPGNHMGNGKDAHGCKGMSSCKGDGSCKADGSCKG